MFSEWVPVSSCRDWNLRIHPARGTTLPTLLNRGSQPVKRLGISIEEKIEAKSKQDKWWTQNANMTCSSSSNTTRQKIQIKHNYQQSLNINIPIRSGKRRRSSNRIIPFPLFRLFPTVSHQCNTRNGRSTSPVMLSNMWFEFHVAWKRNRRCLPTSNLHSSPMLPFQVSTIQVPFTVLMQTSTS